MVRLAIACSVLHECIKMVLQLFCTDMSAYRCAQDSTQTGDCNDNSSCKGHFLMRLYRFQHLHRTEPPFSIYTSLIMIT